MADYADKVRVKSGGDVGNMLILVGKQAGFTTVTGNNNPYS